MTQCSGSAGQQMGWCHGDDATLPWFKGTKKTAAFMVPSRMKYLEQVASGELALRDN